MANYSINLKPVYSLRDRAILQEESGLSVHFQAHALSDRFDGKPNYTIAFGRSDPVGGDIYLALETPAGRRVDLLKRLRRKGFARHQKATTFQSLRGI
jgi:hypothetical protein